MGVKIDTSGGHKIIADDDDKGGSAIQLASTDKHTVTLADSLTAAPASSL